MKSQDIETMAQLLQSLVGDGGIKRIEHDACLLSMITEDRTGQIWVIMHMELINNMVVLNWCPPNEEDLFDPSLQVMSDSMDFEPESVVAVLVDFCERNNQKNRK